MSGSGKGVSGVVGISRNGSGAGTFPDTFSQKIFTTAQTHIPPLMQCHRSHMTRALSDALQEHYMADFSLTKDVVATVRAKFSP